MTGLLRAALRRHAYSSPAQVALQDRHGALTYGELLGEVERLAAVLVRSQARCVAILADNSRDWVLTDLAAHMADITAIPLPLFFSARQLAHTLHRARVDQVITDQPGRVIAALQLQELPAESFQGNLVRMFPPQAGTPGAAPPKGTTKITFTSGTTGEPKGVCLGRADIEAVAESLRLASAGTALDRHLCLLPLATLLENIAGLYTPLLAGATICAPALAEVGMTGSSGLDAGKMLRALDAWQASTAITVPQTLQAMVSAARAGGRLPSTLRYVALGGAPVAPRLLDEAHKLGIPVYEGYGLSECASVVAVNSPADKRPGSVGKPLRHVRVSFGGDGEILVHGVRWRGYLGGEDVADGASVVATGDIGYRDPDGFIHITGRKKNIFITSFGRNVAPEWVERELVLRPPILQAAVFGEARRFNTAVIVARPSATPSAIEAALADANLNLPDYARVGAWVPADEPFSPLNGMLTHNGRPRREAIMARHATQIDSIYHFTT